MWAMKYGYDYIVVNFGGYHYAKTLVEALGILAEWRKRDPHTQVYSNGFFSENLKKHVGKGQWFPVRDAKGEYV